MSGVGERNGTVYACDGYGLPVDWGQKIPEFGSADEHEETMEKFAGELPDEYYPDMGQIQDLRRGGLIITHAHQDHFRGWWKLRGKDRDFAIITDPFSGKVIVNDAMKDGRIPPEKFFYEETVEAGPFRVRRFPVNHSIYGASGVLIEAEGRRMVHLGDVKPWRVRGGKDKNAEVFGALELARGIDHLFLDATNAPETGFVISEEAVEAKIEATLLEHRHVRVLFTTILSNVRRQESVINAAYKQRRPVFVVGRNAINFLEITGVEKDKWRPMYQMTERDSNGIPTGRRFLKPDPSQVPHDAVIIVSGSQGEPMSFLDNLAEGRIHLPQRPGDILICSQDTIPTLEIEKRFTRAMGEISARVDEIHLPEATPKFESQGAELHYDPIWHSSGHSMQGDLKLLLTIFKPKLFTPCHADRERRELLAALGEEWGADWGCKAVLLDDGDRLTL
jgi:ribonuclease J